MFVAGYIGFMLLSQILPPMFVFNFNKKLPRFGYEIRTIIGRFGKSDIMCCFGMLRRL